MLAVTTESCFSQLAEQQMPLQFSKVDLHLTQRPVAARRRGAVRPLLRPADDIDFVGVHQLPAAQSLPTSFPTWVN